MGLHRGWNPALLVDSRTSTGSYPPYGGFFSAPKGLQASSAATASPWRAAHGGGRSPCERANATESEPQRAVGLWGRSPAPRAKRGATWEAGRVERSAGVPAFRALRARKEGAAQARRPPAIPSLLGDGARLRRPGFPGCPAVAGGALAVGDIAGVQPAKVITAAFSRVCDGRWPVRARSVRNTNGGTYTFACSLHGSNQGDLNHENRRENPRWPSCRRSQ